MTPNSGAVLGASHDRGYDLPSLELADVESGRRTLATVLAATAVAGAAFLRPTFFGGFVIADVFILAMIASWLPTLPAGRPRRVLAAVIIPLTWIMAGSLIGSLFVGLRPWIVVTLIKDLGGFASFLAMVYVLHTGGERARKAVGWTAAFGVTAVSLVLLLETSTRARAAFDNPNLAGHYLAAHLIVLLKAPLPRWLRILSVTAGVVGLGAVGSFGGLLMMLVAVTYMIATAPRRKVVIRWALITMAAVGGLWLVLPLNVEPDTGFNADHFERSADGRFARWDAAFDIARAYPLGIGPGSNSGLGLLPQSKEAHNEYLAYLTERGLIGLVGLILLYYAIWKLGRRGGLVRALLLAIAAQSLVRETLHYRHLWLLLGYAVFLEEFQSVPKSEPAGK